MPYEDFSPEIQSLIADPNSSSNPEAQQKIEQAYRDKYGTGDVDDEGAVPKPPGSAATANVDPTTPTPLSESAEVALDVLRAEWGAAYDVNYEEAKIIASEVPMELAASLEDSYPGVGNDPRVIKILRHLSSRFQRRA